MRSNMKKWTLALVAGIIVGSAGWIANALAQGDMSQDMEMMKNMMMSRPASMKKCDASIQAVKEKAMKEGKYGCCLKHSCDFCALKMGQCPCGMHAKEDKPVCNECKGSWYAGDGAVPDKTADQIKTLPRPLPM